MEQTTAPRGDFLDWLGDLPWEETGVFFGAGLLGMLVHWGKKAAYHEVSFNPLRYFFVDYPWRTTVTLTSFAGTTFTFVTTDLLVSMTWGQIITQGVTAGVALNAMLNKGTKPTEVAAPEKTDGAS